MYVLVVFTLVISTCILYVQDISLKNIRRVFLLNEITGLLTKIYLHVTGPL